MKHSLYAAHMNISQHGSLDKPTDVFVFLLSNHIKGIFLTNLEMKIMTIIQ